MNNRITELLGMSQGRVESILGIKYPIIQGPMAWLTNAELVAAVSNSGGLGILGPNAGQTTVTTSIEETAERMRREIKKTKELTDKPFAVTLIVDYDLSFTSPILQIVIDEGVKAVLINGILDENIFKQLKEHDIKIIFRPQTPSIADAQAAEKMGADIYVATGFDEGGTVPDRVIGTFTVVPMIVDAVQDMPIMAAGGIADVRGVRAAFALGAEGVFAGSRFIPVTESPAAENVKQLIVDSTAEDLLLFRTVPSYYRSLPGKLAEKLVEMDQQGASREAIAQKMNGTRNMKVGMLEGDTEEGYVSVGTGITPIKKIQSVKEVVLELMQDFIEK